MALLGRRFVVVSETDEGKRLAEATMKRLTGGDPITARWMHQNFVTFTPSHLPILVTNHLPKVSGDDPAIWRRLRVVPWAVVIADDDQEKTLDGKLQLEADGILSWSVKGLRDYLAGGLAEPDSVISSSPRNATPPGKSQPRNYSTPGTAGARSTAPTRSAGRRLGRPSAGSVTPPATPTANAGGTASASSKRRNSDCRTVYLVAHMACVSGEIYFCRSLRSLSQVRAFSVAR